MASAAGRPSLPLASGVLTLTCLALACAPATLSRAMAYDRPEILSGQIWRLWSGHLVHYSPRHALVDAGMLLLIGLVLEPLAGTRRLCIGLALGGPGIALALLWCAPGLLEYRGASGLDMLMAAMALCLLWRSGGLSRSWLMVLGGALLFKTIGEAGGIWLGWSSLPQGVATVWQAHALGAACGVLLFAGSPRKRSSAD